MTALDLKFFDNNDKNDMNSGAQRGVCIFFKDLY